MKQFGIETYVGTSKRVFPKKGIKPIEVLKAIESQLQKNKVSIFLMSSKRLLKSPKLSVVEQPMTRRKAKRDRSFFMGLSLIQNL